MLNGFGYAMFGVPTHDLETTWKSECTTPPAPGHLPLLFKPLEPTSWSVSVRTSVIVMFYPGHMRYMGHHASGLHYFSQTHIKYFFFKCLQFETSEMSQDSSRIKSWIIVWSYINCLKWYGKTIMNSDISADLVGGSWSLFPDITAFPEADWWKPWKPSFDIASSLTEIWTGYLLPHLLVAQIYSLILQFMWELVGGSHSIFHMNKII